MEQAQTDDPDLPSRTEDMARAQDLCQDSPVPDLALT
jgi:hypothetical protein